MNTNGLTLWVKSASSKDFVQTGTLRTNVQTHTYVICIHSTRGTRVCQTQHELKIILCKEMNALQRKQMNLIHLCTNRSEHCNCNENHFILECELK